MISVALMYSCEILSVAVMISVEQMISVEHRILGVAVV